MSICVYLDNNVWDFLFDRGLDLSTELPPDEFCVCITREAEFEIPPIPDSKKQLKNFIYETIKKCTIETKSYFGFHNYDHPQSEQRVGGFGVGSWISQEELSFIKQQKTKIGTKRRNQQNCTIMKQTSLLLPDHFIPSSLHLTRKRAYQRSVQEWWGNYLPKRL